MEKRTKRIRGISLKRGLIKKLCCWLTPDSQGLSYIRNTVKDMETPPGIVLSAEDEELRAVMATNVQKSIELVDTFHPIADEYTLDWYGRLYRSKEAQFQGEEIPDGKTIWDLSREWRRDNNLDESEYTALFNYIRSWTIDTEKIRSAVEKLPASNAIVLRATNLKPETAEMLIHGTPGVSGVPGVYEIKGKF